MSHLFRPPIETTVMIRAEMPYSFVYREEVHVISGVENYWQAEGGWWRPEPVERDMFLVKTTSGLLMCMFRDQITQKWYLECLYD